MQRTTLAQAKEGKIQKKIQGKYTIQMQAANTLAADIQHSTDNSADGEREAVVENGSGGVLHFVCHCVKWKLQGENLERIEEKWQTRRAATAERMTIKMATAAQAKGVATTAIWRSQQ